MSSSPHRPQSAPPACSPGPAMVVVDTTSPPEPFVPRPFPPPSLMHIPIDYVVDQLHKLAPHYWDKPETADCTIIIPIQPTARAAARRPRVSSPSSPSSSTADLASTLPDPAAPGPSRRVPESVLPRRITRMTSKLHIDYLCAQSTLLKDLFSGATPTELLSTAGTSMPPSTTPPMGRRPNQSATPMPVSRLPRVIPSTNNHPVVYLPVPDPSSFPHLVHFMYFGKTTYLQECLNSGAIRWEGLVRNVEFLGMRTEIKVFLGRWYGTQVAGAQQRVTRVDNDLTGRSGGVVDRLEGKMDVDDDLDNHRVSPPDSDSEDDIYEREYDEHIMDAYDEEPPRGRTLTRRRAWPPDRKRTTAASF